MSLKKILLPGAGRTLGKPGVLLSPELLLDPGTVVVPSVVSVRLKENLEKRTLHN